MKTLLLIWSLILGHCLAGPFFFGQQGVVASGATISAPPTVAATLLARWTGDSLAAGSVSTWVDWTGNGHDLTQVTAVKRPVATASLLGIHTGVVFDGVDDCVSVSGFYPFDSSYAVFVVVRPTVVNAAWHALMVQGSTGARPVFIGLNGGFGPPVNTLSMFWSDTNPYAYAPVGGSAVSANTVYDIAASRTNSTPVYLINAVSGATFGSTFDTNNANQLIVGIFNDFSSFPWAGDIFDILIYDSELSSADKTLILDWISNTYLHR